jgi:hypothetical protein
MQHQKLRITSNQTIKLHLRRIWPNCVWAGTSALLVTCQAAPPVRPYYILRHTLLCTCYIVYEFVHPYLCTDRWAVTLSTGGCWRIHPNYRHNKSTPYCVQVISPISRWIYLQFSAALCPVSTVSRTEESQKTGFGETEKIWKTNGGKTTGNLPAASQWPRQPRELHRGAKPRRKQQARSTS